MSFAARALLLRSGPLATSAFIAPAAAVCCSRSVLRTRSCALFTPSANPRIAASAISPPVRSFSFSRPSSSPTARTPRPAVALNTLADVPGAKRPRIRWGRGVGSGKGKTAGRGHKGSHARNAPGLKPWFIGGQTPLYQLLPKRGFKQREKRELDTINLDRLQRWVAAQRIDASQPITMRTLRDSGAIAATVRHGVKLLASGYHTAKHSPPLPPMHIEVSDVSASAKRAVEAAGGSVRLVWHNRLGLRYLLKPHKLAQAPRREAIPPPKYRMKYAAQQAGGERVRSKLGDVLPGRAN